MFCTNNFAIGIIIYLPTYTSINLLIASSTSVILHNITSQIKYIIKAQFFNLRLFVTRKLEVLNELESNWHLQHSSSLYSSFSN